MAYSYSALLARWFPDFWKRSVLALSHADAKDFANEEAMNKYAKGEGGVCKVLQPPPDVNLPCVFTDTAKVSTLSCPQQH